MNDLPAKRLGELVARYGDSLVSEPRRCEALLRDTCGNCSREIHALVEAVELGIGEELLSSWDNHPKSILVARLARQLTEERALAEDAAEWAVRAWITALGLASNSELEAVARTKEARGAGVVEQSDGRTSREGSPNSITQAHHNGAVKFAARKRRVIAFALGIAAASVLALSLGLYSAHHASGTQPRLTPAPAIGLARATPPTPFLTPSASPSRGTDSQLAAPIVASDSPTPSTLPPVELVQERAQANTEFYRHVDLTPVAQIVVGNALAIYQSEAERLHSIDAYIDTRLVDMTIQSTEVNDSDHVVITTHEVWDNIDHRASTDEITGSRRSDATVVYKLVGLAQGWRIEDISFSNITYSPLP